MPSHTSKILTAFPCLILTIHCKVVGIMTLALAHKENNCQHDTGLSRIPVFPRSVLIHFLLVAVSTLTLIYKTFV